MDVWLFWNGVVSRKGYSIVNRIEIGSKILLLRRANLSNGIFTAALD
jgi:hypothetical protein